MKTQLIEETIPQVLKEKLGCTKVEIPRQLTAVGLNQCVIFNTDQGKYFTKMNQKHGFTAEAKALNDILETKTLRVPKPYYFGEDGGVSFLILEYIELHSHTKKSQKILGEKLAELHLTRVSHRISRQVRQDVTPDSFTNIREHCSCNKASIIEDKDGVTDCLNCQRGCEKCGLKKGALKFGYPIPNTIGTTPQINTWNDNWVDFLINNRISFQLKLIEKNYNDNELLKLGEKLIKKIPHLFQGITIYPSLLHGDLWGGNSSADSDGNPVVYDPASYYGHHEADLGIMAMFGGFSPECYEAYHSIIPKEPGFEERNLIYQLYHYLNHYNLFGTSYRSGCLACISSENLLS